MISAAEADEWEKALETAYREGRKDDIERMANFVTPRGEWFAWRPVRVFDQSGERAHWRWTWLETVGWYRVLRGPIVTYYKR